jgi:hypothetical protein
MTAHKSAASSLGHAQTKKSKTTQKEDTMTRTSATQQGSEQAADRNAIRPFHVNVPEAELTELRRRINATRWPERETVTDDSQGVQLATIQALARYWGKDYDWRKVEGRMNSYPQFITEIDGLDIHFLHIRSKHETHCRSSSHTDGPDRSSSR